MLSIAVLSAVFNVSANDRTPSNDIEIIEVKGSYFNDYKVSDAKGAMRGNYSLLETAQSVTVIPETIINEQLATTLGEVLANDASLSPGSKQRNRETFNLRGFGLSSSDGYLRDGHQHWSHYQQPIETLERIEVLKGPSSILYGQSAPGGLINMVTKKPTDTALLNLGIDTDNLGSTRFMLDLGGNVAGLDGVNYRSVLVKQDVNFERKHANGSERERDRFLGYLAIDYQVNDDFVIRTHYDRTNDKANLDTGAWLDDKGKLIGERTTIYDFSWAFTDIRVENKGVDLEYHFSNTMNVTLGYNAQDFARQRFESAPRKPKNYTVESPYTSRPYDRFDDWQFRTAYIDFNSEFETLGVTHQFLIGANSLDYYYDQLRVSASPINHVVGQAEPTRPDISYHNDNTLYVSSYDYYGVYFQDLITLNQNWQVSIGGRFDKQNKQGADNESFVPKAAVLFHPSVNGTIYASYSEGFEPQASETINDEDDLNYGMKLDAQTSRQYELGTKWQLLDDRVMLNSAIFDISKYNILVTENLANEQYRTTQEGEQNHKGVELSAQGAINDRVFVMASGMYLDASYNSASKFAGKRPIDTPKLSASLWSRYEINDSLALNTGVVYQGERFADNLNTITKASYARVDIGAKYEFTAVNVPLSIRINIENLFNKNYIAGGSVNNAAIGEERNLKLALQASF